MEEWQGEWNLEMAMAVLASDTVDGEQWAEAVKWLLLFGPPEIRTLLSAASVTSFAQAFPGVPVRGHGDSGQPFYALADLAEALGLEPATAAERLLELQDSLGVEFLVEENRVYKVN